jgi:superfamily II DNA or RNA helicase
MLKDCDWSYSRSYRTGSENEPLEFYLTAFSNANSLDLLLGYFSFSAISVLSVGFAKFLANGGKMRVVANNILSKTDKDTILKAQKLDQRDGLIDLEDIRSVRYMLDDYGRHFFECMAWLIKNKRIEFVLIKPKGKLGISHYKEGLFSDGENKVMFSGSCNFTAYGMVENLERLDAYLSWENSRSSKKIGDLKQDFEKLFNQENDTVVYIPVDEVEEAIKDEFGSKDLQQLLTSEQELMRIRQGLSENKRLLKLLRSTEEQLKYIASKPRFPYPQGPREYQINAYENWLKNNRKGLFAMATGTGKTITSLNCVLGDFKLSGFYKFIVLVPTTALAAQWRDEVVKKFNFQNTVVCSSNNPKWKDELKSIGKNIIFNRAVDYAIITTYATFKGVNFQTILKENFENDYDKLTLIADEAHTMGSPGFVKVLPNYINMRIGLSATPERQFDDNGNKILADFFSTNEDEYTFEYNMKTAIENNILTRYFYYPKIVSLEQSEQEEYLKISKELSKYIDPETGKYRESDYVNNLLIKRKNVIYKASRKVVALLSIVNEIGIENFKDAFIYVPEGIEVDYSEKDESYEEASLNTNLIDVYLKNLYNQFGLKMAKFTGKTTNRDQILNQFKDHKLDALLAMKCLDEGVDIPQAKYAIFCSSTGNPRQYIQRRGRVLRKFKGKEYAVIYDLIVKPVIDHTDTDERLKKIERNIFLSELRRLVNFSVLSENKDSCLNSLESLCCHMDIDIYDLANKELENYNL